MRALLGLGARDECWSVVNVYIAVRALLFLTLELNPFNTIVVFGSKSHDKGLPLTYCGSSSTF